MRDKLLLIPVLGLATLLASCSTTKKLPNGCVVQAIHHQQVIQANRLVRTPGGPGGVLSVSFINKRVGHALSVFEYNNKLWAYDPEKGTRVISTRRGPSWYDPSHLARLAFPRDEVLYAAWL